ncbi:MAG: hypothetical protein FWC62_09035 [Firmicutes bacterium]|nr:hypothetical protein [Bacillota bacterium]
MKKFYLPALFICALSFLLLTACGVSSVTAADTPSAIPTVAESEAPLSASPPPPSAPSPTETPTPSASPDTQTYEYDVRGGADNAVIAHVIATIDAADNWAEYQLTESTGAMRIIDIRYDDSAKDYILILFSEEGESMQTIPGITQTFDFSDRSGDTSLKFVDVDGDGYADIRVNDTRGMENAEFVDYIWSPSALQYLATK